MAPIGLIANPASGKDVRRLVAQASTFSNTEKGNIIRRVVHGALAAGATRFLYMPDSHQIVANALASLPRTPCCAPLAVPCTATALDSERAAVAMREAGCAVVVTLGGDGTNRSAARGWRDLPLIAISTGTNNVFPLMLEGTIAGMAAGLIASGRVPIDRVATSAKCCEVRIDDEDDDLALVDAALLSGAFIGARAIWDPATLRAAVLSRAEPASVGLAAIGGLLQPIGTDENAGLAIEFGTGGVTVRAPIAPGRFAAVSVCRRWRLALGEPLSLRGPGLLALDGERERRLRPGQGVRVRVRRDGPRVVDVPLTLATAAKLGFFCINQNDADTTGALAPLLRGA